MTQVSGTVPAAIVALGAELTEWLKAHALPLWATVGVDPVTHAFVEAIARDGVALRLARRARVTPRQVYALTRGSKLGWRTDPQPVVARAWAHYVAHYRRSDGLYRSLVSATGAMIDDTARLYDQAFVLLALAEASRLWPEQRLWARDANTLRDLVVARFRAADGGFWSVGADDAVRESNPHMHLLEACLAWSRVSTDHQWSRLAEELVELAMTRFRSGTHGAVLEQFTAQWQPAGGGLIEPGHQYEWAWLLLRAAPIGGTAAATAALDLIEVGERLGVSEGFVITSVAGDGKVYDRSARLWPQTERLKAALEAAARTGKPAYWEIALAAGRAIHRYLDEKHPGLWFDVRLADGTIEPGPSPASTLYHLVCAISCLNELLGGDR